MWKNLSRLITLLAVISQLFANTAPVQAGLLDPDNFSTISPIDGATNILYSQVLTWEDTNLLHYWVVCVGRVEDWDSCDFKEQFDDSVTSVRLDSITRVSGKPDLTPGTKYYWKVLANNDDGAVEHHTYSNNNTYVSFTTKPVPGAFNKTAPTNSSVDQNKNITLSWSASTSITRYDYCYDTTNNSACDGTWTSAGTNTSVSLSNLSTGVKYYWQVRAVNEMDTVYADSSTWWNFTVQNVPAAFNKSAPASGSTGQNTGLTLSWGSSTYASSYAFCVGTSSGSCNTIAWTGTGTNTSTVPVGLGTGTTYYWQTKAINQNGETTANGGTWWSFATAGIPQAFSKSAPANAATGVNKNPSITWNASTNATSYAYCYDTSNDNACAGTWVTTTNTAVAIGQLTTGATYFWQVKAISPAGETQSNSGTWWSFTVLPEPGAFTKTGPGNASTGIVTRPTLSWTASTNVTTYYYCIDTSNDNACAGGWVSTTNTSAALTGLLPVTTYYWQVKASNINGETQADSSSWFSFTTAQAPGAFTKLSPPNGTVDQLLSLSIGWSLSTSSTSYAYCLDTNNDNSCNGTWVNVGTNTSADITGLTTGTTYYWQVKALNAEDETEADNDTWYAFRTYYVPGTFSKVAPASGATGQLTNLTLAWGTSSHASLYDYCLDTTNDNLCSTGWVQTGVTTAPFSSLTAGISYYWQVRAFNDFASSTANAGTWWSFTTMPLPGAFNLLSPASGTTGLATSTTLIYSTSSSAAQYQICYATTTTTSTEGTCGGNSVTSTSTSTTITGLTPGATYYWRVNSSNVNGSAKGSGGAWWSFSVLPQPGAFTKLAPANSTVDQFIEGLAFSWQPSSNAASYRFCYDTSTNSVCNSTWFATTATSVTVNGLTPNTPYNWQVQAVNINGTVPADSGLWFTFRTLPLPTDFGKLSPASGTTGLAPGSTDLAWNSSSILTGYQVCYDKTNNNTCEGGWGTLIASSTTSLTISSLESFTTYYWQVRATNTNGLTEANGNAWWNFTTTLGPVIPASPVGITAPPRPIFTWPALNGATNYYLQINGPTGGSLYNQWYSAASYCVAGICAVSPAVTLPPGSYTWLVLSWGSNITGPWSAPAAFNVLDLPGKPVPIVPTGTITPIRPTFNWFTGSGLVTDYQIWLNRDTTTMLIQPYTTTEANCNPGGFCTVTMPNTLDLGNYTWWVQARNSSGGTWSDPMNFKVAPPAPEKAVLVWPTSGSIVESRPGFQFSHVPRSGWYLVEVRQNNSLGAVVYNRWYQESSPPVGSYFIAQADTSFPAGTYSWRVATWNESGYGPWSNSEVFNIINTPGPAVLLSPLNLTFTNPQPAYSWAPSVVNGQFSPAADYELYISAATGTVFDQWFTAVEAGCTAASCTVTSTIPLSAGDYSWWVRTRNTSGAGPWSAAGKFKVVPLPPDVVSGLFTPVSGSISVPQPTFSWGPAARATWHLIQVRQGSENGSIVYSQWINSACTPSCQATSTTVLTPGTYYWNALGWNTGGSGSWFSTWSEVVIPAPPAAPLLLSPVGTTSSLSPAYTWQRVAGAVDYQLWVNNPDGTNLTQPWIIDAAACSGANCTTTPGVSHTASGTYSWWVRARNSSGAGPWSAAGTFNVVPLPPDMVSALLTPPNGSIAVPQPAFSWGPAARATWHLIQVRQGSESGTAVFSQWINSTCTPSCTATSTTVLTPGTYYWNALGWNTGGNGSWFSTWRQVVVPPPPGIPSLLSPSGTATVLYPSYTWQRVAGAVEYQLWINNPDGTNLTQPWILDTAACSGGTCTATPAATHEANGVYSWWILARNTSGRGPWSTAMTFNRTLPIPTPVTLSAPLGGASTGHLPVFHWLDNIPASQFRVTVYNGAAEVAGFWVTDLQACGLSVPHTAATPCSATAPASLPSASYTWTILARNPSGTSLSTAGSFNVAP